MILPPLSLESPAVTSLLFVALIAAWWALTLVSQERIGQAQHWFTKATLLQALVDRYEAEAAEEKAVTDRIMAGVMKRVHMEHSRIAVTIADCVTDGEAATEMMQLCVGPLECEGE